MMEKVGDPVALGDLPGEIVLASDDASLKEVRPARPGGDPLAMRDDPIAGLPDVRAEVPLDVHALAMEKAGQPEAGVPERAKVSVDDEPVHGGQRPEDLLRVHLLEQGRHRHPPSL
jgi:hypothetical protein